MKKILFSLIVLISLAAQGQEKNHYGIYRIDSLHETLGSTTDTTTYKPVGVSSTGRKRRLSYWPGSGGSTPTLSQVLTAGNTATNKIINLYHPTDATINTSISYNGYTSWNGNEHTILGYNYLAYTPDAGSNFTNLFFVPPTATRNIYLPNKSGTVALLSDITDSIASGVYTPSVSNLSNVTSDARYSSTMFTRVGKVVTVSGKIQIVPTAAGATSLDLSLPIATNNFSDDSQAAGVGMYINGSSFATAKIYANNATQTVKFVYRAPDTAVADFSFSFSYTIQ